MLRTTQPIESMQEKVQELQQKLTTNIKKLQGPTSADNEAFKERFLKIQVKVDDVGKCMDRLTDLQDRMQMNINDADTKRGLVEYTSRTLETFCEKVKQCSAVENQFISNFITKRPSFTLTPRLRPDDQEGFAKEDYERVNYVIKQWEQHRRQEHARQLNEKTKKTLQQPAKWRKEKKKAAKAAAKAAAREAAQAVTEVQSNKDTNVYRTEETRQALERIRKFNFTESKETIEFKKKVADLGVFI